MYKGMLTAACMHRIALKLLGSVTAHPESGTGTFYEGRESIAASHNARHGRRAPGFAGNYCAISGKTKNINAIME